MHCRPEVESKRLVSSTSASVVGARSSGHKRSIHFRNGLATGSDAGSVKTFTNCDVTTVYIGKERYDIIDAVIYRG